MVKLTVGMATYDDFARTQFTIQALRMYILGFREDVEIVVVDNKPSSPSSQPLVDYINKARMGGFNIRYIPAGEITGTAAPRNRVFEAAEGEIVVCMDSHVLVAGHAMKKLVDWFDAHPDSLDLISGPMVYDSMRLSSTHFANVWRGEMWGVWASAYEVCKGGDHVAVVENGDRAQFVSVDMDQVPLSSSAKCQIDYPDIPYAGHQRVLHDLGWRPLGWDDDDEFEIPGQGLGLFACRKQAWLGFNPLFRGFGGEELYIHEKFRQAGRRCLSLGFLKWWHSFGHPGGMKYPAQLWDKVRNYVLGHIELGRPLDDIHRHFVTDTKKLDQKSWEILIENPQLPKPLTVSPSPATAQPATIDLLFDTIEAKPRDLDQHMPYLRELASRCEHVTEISKRRESLIAFAAGRPERVVSYNTEASDQAVAQVRSLCSYVSVENKKSDEIAEIDLTDLLFIDSKHTKEQLKKELDKFANSVRRYIVCHDTQTYSTRGEDGSTGGLLTALKEFCEERPDWFVVSHTPAQHGLTVLSINPDDKPAKPMQPWPLGKGPGTELKKLLSSMGAEPNPACPCNTRMEQMDRWGVQGCRDNFETIVGWMDQGQEAWGWKEKIKAATLAAKSGLALKIAGAHPIRNLVNLAIDNAEKKESVA